MPKPQINIEFLESDGAPSVRLTRITFRSDDREAMRFIRDWLSRDLLTADLVDLATRRDEPRDPAKPAQT